MRKLLFTVTVASLLSLGSPATSALAGEGTPGPGDLTAPVAAVLDTIYGPPACC